MEIIKVQPSVGGSYEVMIGSGLLKSCGNIIRETADVCRVAVITDSTVEKLYLNTVVTSLEEAGFKVYYYSFSPGESSKNIYTLSDILEFLAKAGLTRTDMIASLGGGVVGDVSGFAAGCFMRGVRFVQLPTTLLASVDSSVGGKTAVDLKAGKNLAGLFYQPQSVICDTDCLNTLPQTLMADGYAEALKMSVLSGESFFSVFESGGEKSLPEIIARCIRFKGEIVQSDELENGIRKMLNLGHTVGHAVEKCSDYRITHGHAVAIGLAVISRSAARMKLCSISCARRIETALIKYSLPIFSPFSAPELAAASLSDKKRSGNDITLVLPREIGDCVMQKFPISELTDIISVGLGALI